MGKKLPHFTAKLPRQCFIMRQNQCGFINARDYIRHRKGFAGAGHPQQNLLIHAAFQPVHKLLNRLGLIAGRLIF